MTRLRGPEESAQPHARCAAAVAAVAAAFLSSAWAVAEPSLWLPAVFGDHMVLQRGRPVPVWGRATPGASVRVEVAGRESRALADGTGAWRVMLPTLEAGGPHELVVTGGDERVVFGDVLVGEVWLCSGQSNMAWTVAESNGGAEAARVADDAGLRIMLVQRATSVELQPDVPGAWARADAAALGEFSGVGYFFGRAVRQELDVPVGLVCAALGGSAAEAWLPAGHFADHPGLGNLRTSAAQRAEEHERIMSAWAAQAAQARAAGGRAPEEPQGAFGWMQGSRPAAMWNAMLGPIAPFAFAGAIWYQGETNVGRAAEYQVLLPAVMSAWREAFEFPAMPFGIVQLANFADPFPGGGSWPELREAQGIVADADAAAGLVVTIDVGDPTDIHPRDKRTVGERLASWALADVYQRSVSPGTSASPHVREVVAEGERVRIRFDGVGSGLRTRGGGPLRGFALGGHDGSWTWATGTIVAPDTVEITGKWMRNPRCVRYAWDNNPDWATLENSAGLPARPFRGDVVVSENPE